MLGNAPVKASRLSSVSAAQHRLRTGQSWQCPIRSGKTPRRPQLSPWRGF